MHLKASVFTGPQDQVLSEENIYLFLVRFKFFKNNSQ